MRDIRDPLWAKRHNNSVDPGRRNPMSSWKKRVDGSWYLAATHPGFTSHSIIRERVWSKGKRVMRYALYAYKDDKWQLLAHYGTLAEAKKSGGPVGSAPWLSNPATWTPRQVSKQEVLRLLRDMVPQEFRGEDWDRHTILKHYEKRVTRALPDVNWRDRDNYTALHKALAHVQTDSTWDGKGLFIQSWLP